VQMNAGAAAASGDLLCFLHADTRPPSDLVSVRRPPTCWTAASAESAKGLGSACGSPLLNDLT
jgi:hypothetical protein